ncbi:glycoprotein 3-alpha-L-fucosyltransferase A [Hydra vulgaris]|uniref:glycoprotein 3-alpha-L-fucosyltransferase A n=1 Tax=Hydra vulgaris TaxID=6087 RepID=UPI001F5ECF5D|nr:glycoprotein 3-alpha-L-fucosyltransferase A-like [Hydra vulgaris]
MWFKSSKIMPKTDGQRKKFILTSYVLFVLTFYLLKWNYSYSNQHKETILVLFYTPFFGEKPWSYVGSDDLAKNCGCYLNNCQFSYDINLFNKSDAVLFNGRDLPFYGDLLQLALRKPSFQLWGFFSMESNLNTLVADKFDSIFDFISSYHLDSDVRIPYRYHFPKKKIMHIKRIDRKQSQMFPRTNYFKSKTKSVAWFVSNCQAYQRNLLAQSLLQHGIKLEIYGKCTQDFFNQSLSCSGKSCEKELKKFKFYFAAENSLCTDYITEKYWFTAIDSNTIPIVFGGANYNNENLAIPGSYINVFDFNSSKALADYIKLLEFDEKKFNSYFEWKLDWDLSPKSCSQYACSLCNKMRKGINPHKKSLKEVFHVSGCNQATSKFMKWIKL